MRWNKPANADRQALIANAMGHPGEDAGDVLDRFIRGLDMLGPLVNIRIHGDHAHAELPTRPRYPNRDLPSIGDQDLVEHLELTCGTRRSVWAE